MPHPGRRATRFAGFPAISYNHGAVSQHPHEKPASTWTVLGWALYLACSWTWCIGVFLPVLLVRDYGPWGFVVFAVPNVVGAAAMGWVLSKRHAPRVILERHGMAVRAFAVVTIVFQAYFLGLLLNWTGFFQAGSGALIVFVLAGVLVPIAARARWLALVTWTLSIACAVIAWRTGATAPLANTAPPVGLLWLAPVCLFGFALCPYLDPTFLRAAESLHDSGRRTAFTLGFGVFFLAMILFTLAYGGDVRLFAQTVLDSLTAKGVVFLHIGAQLAFTMLVHWRELARMRPKSRAALLCAGIGAVLAAAGAFSLDWPILTDFVPSASAPELYYRCFMAFYGLVFPAYVWLCMIPTRDGHSGIGGQRGRRKLLAWCGAVGVAAPFFWMGFVMRQELFLAPGLLVVLLARLAVRTGLGETARHP